METKAQSLVQIFLSDYLQKVYYFCLKRTSDPAEAEDLASEVSLAVISSLNRGNEPEHFSAWVWQIARNCYSSWAERKHRHLEKMTETDVYEQEIPDDQASILERYIQEEQMQALRRELAFVATEYRELIAAYYLENRSIKEIAASLGCPMGTVMTKLHRARKILKEGMNMAREFGQRSYHPERLSFCASGNQPTGLPWAAINHHFGFPRLLPVNILCEANNNPCTMEELAVELGVAMPYLEEEVGHLVRSELLKKLEDGRYLTAFFISPKECQNEMNELTCQFSEVHAREIWELAGQALQKAKELGALMRAYSEDDAHMFFAFYFQAMLERSTLPKNIYHWFHRADGGDWGYIGFESGSECRLPFTGFNNNGECMDKPEFYVWWDGFQVNDKECTSQDYFTKKRHQADEPEWRLLPFLYQLVTGSAQTETLSAQEKNILDELLRQGFCKRLEGGEVVVNAIVYSQAEKDALDAYVKSLPLYLSLQRAMEEHVAEARKIIAKYSNPYLKEDFDYYVGMSLFLRPVMSCLWKDLGLYKGGSQQFCFLLYECKG